MTRWGGGGGGQNVYQMSPLHGKIDCFGSPMKQEVMTGVDEVPELDIKQSHTSRFGTRQCCNVTGIFMMRTLH